MIFVRGDLHGDIVTGLSFKLNKELREATMNDVIVVCGDIGLGFAGEDKELKYVLDWLAQRNTNYIFVRGNHDNCFYWDSCPYTNGNETVQLRRGMLQNAKCGDKVYSNVFLVNHTAIIGINGKHCLFIGGGQSHDVFNLVYPHEKERIREYKKRNAWFRTVGVNWWINEQINVPYANSIIFEGLDKFDYVFTHEAPACLLEKGLITRGLRRLQPSAGEYFLDRVRSMKSISHWYCGHYHINQDFKIDDTNIHVRYSEIDKLE